MKYKQTGYNSFLKEVEKIKNNGLRLGQNYFNVLSNEKPRLAKKIKGTEYDPFDNDNNIEKFLDFIKEKFYIIKPNFGYKILNFNRNLMFHTADKKQADSVLNKLLNNEDISDEIADVNFEPKLLIIDNRHYVNHYLIRNDEELNKVSFDYLSEKRYDKYELEKTDLTQKYIDMCPDAKLKFQMQFQLDSINKNNKNLIEHNKYVDILNDRISNNNINGCYELLCHFESTELKDFDNI